MLQRVAQPRHTFHSIYPMSKVTLINALLNIQRTVFNRLGKGKLHIINSKGIEANGRAKL